MALLVAEIVLCVIGAVGTVNTLGNLRAFRRLRDFRSARSGEPFVSVLVPARDEERSLGACLASLRAQDYGAYEVIVLDDGSTDRTPAIAREAACADARVRVVAGAPVPPGWLGKLWACDQLARAARGDILIFTDADTVHAPTMVASVAGAVAGGADLVTAFPEQEIGSLGEALLVPFMLFTVWVFLPVGRVWTDPSPRVIAANGQLLSFTRAAYAKIGGHAAVRATVLEDMALARRAKAAGLRVRLVDGAGTIRTRMYRSAAETWRGFSKNAYGLVGQTIVAAIPIAVALLALYVLPLVVLVGGLVAGKGGWAWRWLPLALVGMALVQRAIVAARGRMPFWQIALHPLSVLNFVAVLANSARWHRRGYGEWKGRRIALAADPRTPPRP
jgi:chlorobactene glucosyltransferase